MRKKKSSPKKKVSSRKKTAKKKDVKHKKVNVSAKKTKERKVKIHKTKRTKHKKSKVIKKTKHKEPKDIKISEVKKVEEVKEPEPRHDVSEKKPKPKKEKRNFFEFLFPKRFKKEPQKKVMPEVVKGETKSESEPKPEPKAEEKKQEKETKPKKGEKLGKKIVKEEIKKEIKNGSIKIRTQVSDVMYTQYKTISEEHDINKVLEVMLEYSITLLPVVNRKGKIVGIIDQEDLMDMMEKRKVFDPVKDSLELKKIAQLTAKELMKPPVSINEDETTVDASDKMAKEDLNSIFVTNKKGKIIGMLKDEDVMKSIQSEYFMNKAGVEGKIVIKTGIDDLVNLLKEKKSMKVGEIAIEMGITKERVTEWGILLENKELIEIGHPLVGDSVLRWKDEK
jgi:CBS domain-containing protein